MNPKGYHLDGCQKHFAGLQPGDEVIGRRILLADTPTSGGVDSNIREWTASLHELATAIERVIELLSILDEGLRRKEEP